MSSDIISNLRAIIISSKQGLLISNVQKDYVEAFGTKVPLDVLECSSLREVFEKYSSDFQLHGDKVEAVIKSNSAHISSLVNRQGGKWKGSKTSKTVKSHRRPKSSGFKYPSEITSSSAKKNKCDPPGRFTKGNEVNHGGTNIQTTFQEMARQLEKMTLRKPHKLKENNSGSLSCNQPVTSSVSHVEEPVLTQNMTELKSITKTITNSKFSESKSLDIPDNQLKHDSPKIDYLEPFKDVEDLPIGKAQSRLLRQKHKILKEWQSSEANQQHSSDASEVFFDLDSLQSPTLNHQAPSDSTQYSSNASRLISNTPQETSDNSPFSHPSPILTQRPPIIPVLFPRQKAQSRLVSIKSMIQSNINQIENCDNSSECFNITNNNENSDSNNNNNKMCSLVHSKVPGLISGELAGLHCKLKRLDSGCKLQDVCETPAVDFPSRNNTVESELYVTKLKNLCDLKALSEPIYTIKVREPKNQHKQFSCNVEIPNYLQLSSGPVETLNSDLAKELAAKKLYQLLSGEKYSEITQKNNVELIMTRLKELVDSSCGGILSNKLPILYKSRYNDDLAENWMDLVIKSSTFLTKYVDNSNFIITKKTGTIPKGNIKDYNFCQQSQSERTMTLKLPELKLPESEYWEIYITNIVNSAEIWCRLIGDIYSDAYDAMMTKLELEPPEKKIENVKIGEIYGIKVSAIWYRVQLTELIDDKQGNIFYIDVGDRDIVDLEELYRPESVYFTVAPQAMKISLFELESFSGDEDLTSVITGNLLGNTYIAEIISSEKESLYENKSIEKYETRTVRLWDTSTDIDLNVNQLLLNNIIKNITLPSLPSIAQIKEVLVSCVNENGDIYIQTNKKSVHHLHCIILNKIRSGDDNLPVSRTTNTIGTDILYLTKCKKHNSYCRAKIIEIQNSDIVHVLFIDYGYIEKMSVTELIDLQKSSILQAIPPQAVKVRLSNVTNFKSNDMVKLCNMILDQDVLMKVVSTSKGNVPLVELFKRSTTGSILYSVNMKIIAQPETNSTDCPSRRKSVVMGLETVFPKNLPSPDLPNIGEHFEVFVPMASSPDLFIVQPLASRKQLMQMMTELQILCEDSNHSSLPLENFEVGELYAVKHPDGNWYRGCAQAVVGCYTYSVYLCDFGDCIMVTKEKLMALPKKFRTSPYQAVRATLFGIPPEYKDWTPVDCVTFYKLVVEKYFVSTVMEINRDEKNPNYVNLGLVLTDTSGDTDVYIHKVLMENKHEAFTFIKSLNNG